MLIELVVVAGGHTLSPDVAGAGTRPIPPLSVTPNTQALGELFYTHYIYLFQGAGMILLVAMVGAIVLTHRRRTGVRKQRIGEQIARRAEESIELHDVPTGKGL